MFDGTWQGDDAGWGCDCADCRNYRVWETEGTEDWEPERDGWSAWTTTSTSVDAETARVGGTSATETLAG
jgi:hypothetical protein